MGRGGGGTGVEGAHGGAATAAVDEVAFGGGDGGGVGGGLVGPDRPDAGAAAAAVKSSVFTRYSPARTATVTPRLPVLSSARTASRSSVRSLLSLSTMMPPTRSPPSVKNDVTMRS